MLLSLRKSCVLPELPNMPNLIMKALPARVQSSLNPGGISYEHFSNYPISVPAPGRDEQPRMDDGSRANFARRPSDVRPALGIELVANFVTAPCLSHFARSHFTP